MQADIDRAGNFLDVFRKVSAWVEGLDKADDFLSVLPDVWHFNTLTRHIKVNGVSSDLLDYPVILEKEYGTLKGIREYANNTKRSTLG